MKLDFVPTSLYLGCFGKNDKENCEEEYCMVEGELLHDNLLVGNSKIDLTEEEQEKVRSVIRSASKRKNKTVNNS